MSSTLPSNMPSRRNVVRSAAWTVPVVAASTAVPAYAASCGSTSYNWRLDWQNNTTTDAFTTSYSVDKPAGANSVHVGTAVITGPPGSSAVIVTFKNSVVGTDRRHPTNMTVESTTNIGNLGAQERGLLLWNTNILAGREASRQVVDITFSRAVSNLRFTITDIDSNNSPGSANDYRDQVELTGVRTGVATARGGGNFYVVGAGTQASPWQMYDNDTAAGDSADARGNLAVTYAGPVSSFRLDYWNSSGNGQQAIFLSDFTFDALGC
jgi:hypothetical protein